MQDQSKREGAHLFPPLGSQGESRDLKSQPGRKFES
jgi:hypothetical protein